MKKVIFYLLGIVVLLVVVFLSIGFFVPVIEYTTTVEINKPRDVTWAVLRKRKDWIYGFKSFEQVSGVPNEVGSRTRVTVVRDGVESTFDGELKNIRPPEMVESELSNNMLVHDAVVQLTDEGEKTLLISNEKITGRNPFYRSMFVLFKGRITSISAKNFDGLKQVVEGAE